MRPLGFRLVAAVALALVHAAPLVTVYHRSLDVPVHAGAAHGLDITWQGCGEQGLCYPPQHRTVFLSHPPPHP